MLKLGGFSCGHGEEAIDGGRFLVHDWPEKEREKMLGFMKDHKE